MLFAAHFIDDYNTLLGRTVRRISPEAQHLLQAYPWPGNVRELKNIIERAMILSSGDELLPAHFPQEITGQRVSGEGGATDPWEHWFALHPPGPISLEDVVARTEQYFLRWALKMAHQNRTRAAELPGFAKVDQLHYLLRKYGLD